MTWGAVIIWQVLITCMMRWRCLTCLKWHLVKRLVLWSSDFSYSCNLSPCHIGLTLHYNHNLSCGHILSSQQDKNTKNTCHMITSYSCDKSRSYMEMWWSCHKFIKWCSDEVLINVYQSSLFTQTKKQFQMTFPSVAESLHQ